MEYPFEVVYKALTDFMVDNPLPAADVPPTLMAFQVTDGKLVGSQEVDIDIEAMMSMGNLGKALIGQVIGQIVADLPESCCLALVHEAYARRIEPENGATFEEARAQAPADLSTDPLAQEVVVIHMYRRGEHRMGSCPIRRTEGVEQRAVEYGPLHELAHTEGRLVPDICRSNQPTS